MSQQLTPVNGGVIPEVQTTTLTARLNVLSPQYIGVKNLQSRPTEWVPDGRPIYRRLPAVGQTYQVDFFNIVNEGTSGYRAEEIGGVFVPWGVSPNGPETVEVVASENKQNLLIKGGDVIWKYGKNTVLPTIVNLQVLDAFSGKYDLAYQLIYDDSPVPKLYEVEDFALTGLPLNITSSADSVLGWRYPAVNAFLNTSSNFWANKDTFFPSYAQPTTSFLQWETELTQSYKKITLRCPANTAYTGSATLSYVNGTTLTFVETVTISSDSTGQFFEFTVEEPVLQTGWNVTFSSLDISITSITVSGTLTLLEQQAALSPRATLVMYPIGTLPKTVTNSQGKKIPAVYCELAQVDITRDYKVARIEDTRIILRQDYVPVADWLTVPFDQDLIDLYEQVSGYDTLWMAPATCMKQEYATLKADQVIVEV